MSVKCYVGLGSNQADPADQLRRACRALAGLQQTRLAACSRLYSSAPMGPQDQPAYINAVALLITDLPALALLDALQSIELNQGRQRKAERWGPRTLDLDILLYGDQQIRQERLEVPHYHMHARAFVLYPLAELEPDLILPDGSTLQSWLENCPADGLQPLADPRAQG